MQTHERYPAPLPGKNAITQADDPEGKFVTPLKGAPGAWVDEGFDQLKVAVSIIPDIDALKRSAAIGSVAHVGGNIDPFEVAINPAAYLDDDEFKDVGLEQVYEAQMIEFLVSGCSRGFTHEMVRTRNGASYNQQTFRHTDLTATKVRMPSVIADDDDAREAWLRAVGAARNAYEALVSYGVPYEDARTVLPMGTETWIQVRMPWRTFVDTFAYRACYMFYPEMQEVMRRVYAELVKEDARFEGMLSITCEKTKTCEYRGAEPTENGACPFIWAGRRRWVPPVTGRWEGREYLEIGEWDNRHPVLLAGINAGQRVFPEPQRSDRQYDEDGLLERSDEWRSERGQR